MSSYLGIDVGEKRIGIAVCDTSAPFPSPLTTLEASESLTEEFLTLLKKHSVSAVVIGLPRNQNGERTAQTDRVEKIAQLLNIPSDITVYWQDESLTSVKAEHELESKKKPYKKADIDSLAATYILEDFISSGQLIGQPIESQADKLPSHASKQKVSKKPKKKPKKHTFLKIFITLVGATIIMSLSLVGWYLSATSAKSSSENYKIITIKTGSGTQVIADDLHEAGIIKSSRGFTAYIRLNSIDNLQAGSYRLSSNQSVSQIAEIISKGKVTSVNVLISPGLRLDEILAALEKGGYEKSDLDMALKNVRDHKILKGLDKNARLEGYLFPDTYKIDPSTSAETLIRLMLDNFYSKLTPELMQGIKAQGISFHQAVILASIVQKEEPNPETQKTVAQVFLKRLSEGSPLGADPTFKYAAKQFGDENSPASNSPFNTRKIVGLPPTAIANFNLSALEAVANPTATNYSYFVHGDDGKAYFSETLQQHQEKTKLYCTKLCQ